MPVKHCFSLEIHYFSSVVGLVSKQGNINFFSKSHFIEISYYSISLARQRRFVFPANEDMMLGNT